MEGEAGPPFASLDFLYMPSRDVAAGVEHFPPVAGGRPVFAIEAFDPRVAMLQLSEGPPAVLLAGHLEGERPILVYRVDALEPAIETLEGRGWRHDSHFEFPYGPGVLFSAPGGHRLAVYELTRPEMKERLAGRRDF